MPLKHLVVHLDSTPRAGERLGLAVTLARRHGATLAGLFSESPLLGPAIVGRRSREAIATAAAEARARFEAETAAAGVPTQWWEIESPEYAEVIGWTAVSCRYADLAIFGQHDEESSRVPHGLVEQVLLECGRPVLVVPNVGRYPDVGQRVLVAWTGSRDSARALNDALPLMANAQEVTVLAFQHPSGAAAGAGPLPALDVAGHLRLHGIEARYERAFLDDLGMVDHLLNRAADAGADLTVVGAYGHRGLPHLPRSDTTRALLRTMTTPMLLSH